MKPVLLLTMAAAILAASVARADLPVGAYAPDIEAKDWLNSDEPVSLSQVRGMVVVLFFWVSFHEGGQRSMTLINTVESNRNLGRSRGVMVIGLTDADKKRTEPVLKEEKVFYPVGAESKTFKEYEINSFPRVVILDTSGKVAWSGWPGNEDELVKAVLAVLAKTPPNKTHPAEAKKCRQSLDAAREAIRKQNYRDAFQSARDAFEHAVNGDPLKTLCQDMLDLIEAIGKDKLADADKLAETKNYGDAVKTWRTVGRQFRGLEVSKTAKQRLDAAQKQYPEIAKLLGAQESSDKARVALAKARDMIQNRRFGEGYEALETIRKDYAGTDQADTAGEILERLKKTPNAMAAVRDHQAARECKTWLSNARSYIQSNRSKEAKDLLRKIIDKYPDTSFADEAARELTRLP